MKPLCNSGHCLPTRAAAFSSRTVFWSSRPNSHVESVHPASRQRGNSCSIPTKAGRTSPPAVRWCTRYGVVSKNMSTDVPRPVRPVIVRARLAYRHRSTPWQERPFSLVSKRTVRLLPPRLALTACPTQVHICR